MPFSEKVHNSMRLTQVRIHLVTFKPGERDDVLWGMRGLKGKGERGNGRVTPSYAF